MEKKIGYVFNDACKWEPAGKGLRRKILGYDQDLMMVLVEFEKGAAAPLHKHPHKQVSYCISGSCEVTIGGETRLMSAGDCFMVPPDIEHSVRAVPESLLIDVFNPCRKDFL